MGRGAAAPSGKSKLAEAIRYATSRRTALERFVSDGRIEIDSNTVERAIRPQTITRKNALFAGSHGGGRTGATIATLPQTAKMNDVDPHAWLTQTLERIAQGWPISQIDALMPWHFKTASVWRLRCRSLCRPSNCSGSQSTSCISAGNPVTLWACPGVDEPDQQAFRVGACVDLGQVAAARTAEHAAN